MKSSRKKWQGKRAEGGGRKGNEKRGEGGEGDYGVRRVVQCNA